MPNYGITNSIVQQLYVLLSTSTINCFTNGLTMHIYMQLQSFYMDLCIYRPQQDHRYACRFKTAYALSIFYT